MKRIPRIQIDGQDLDDEEIWMIKKVMRRERDFHANRLKGCARLLELLEGKIQDDEDDDIWAPLPALEVKGT